MQSISGPKLAALGVSTSVLGFASSQFLVGTGSAFPVAPASLALSLAVIGIGVFAASFPIRKYAKGREKGLVVKRPNPLVAFRILLLARASVITAAGFVGWFLGQLIWLNTFGNPVEALVGGSLLSVGAAALMMLLGVLAELNCKVPKDPDGEVKS